MRQAHLAVAGIVLLTASPRDACRNACDFYERCEGNVRQTCGGIDQCIGRSLREEPCLAPNESCVARGTRAACVRAPVTSCDSSFVERCEGGVWLRCNSYLGDGYVVALDCAATPGLTCGPGASDRPQCVPVP
jgi:hypothetical protein